MSEQLYRIGTIKPRNVDYMINSGELVLVVPCEHGMIDPHETVVDQEFTDIPLCPGAVGEDDHD